MAQGLSDFVKTYVAIVAVLAVLAGLLAAIANVPLALVAWQVYAWGGLAYVVASLLAWTGFANLYRYSPTLFVGSPSYRRQAIRGDMWKEGRDNGALLVGVAFGVALMALGAALFSWVFAVADAVGVTLVALVLAWRAPRVHRSA